MDEGVSRDQRRRCAGHADQQLDLGHWNPAGPARCSCVGCIGYAPSSSARGDVMPRSPLNVVAVSNDALRWELFDRLLVDDNNYDAIVVESIPRAYSRIRKLQPDVVVLFMEIDDVDACQLL